MVVMNFVSWCKNKRTVKFNSLRIFYENFRNVYDAFIFSVCTPVVMFHKWCMFANKIVGYNVYKHKGAFVCTVYVCTIPY